MSFSATSLQVFAESLEKKRKKNLHFAFFQGDPSISSIKVPILCSSETSAAIPYRNLSCEKPSCVFEKQQILRLFAVSQGKVSVLCQNCGVLLKFAEFFQDVSLRQVYELVWEKFNKKSKDFCRNVKISRTGECFAEIPEYFREFLQKNRENFAKTRENPCFLCEIAMPKSQVPMKFAQKSGEFPRISQFSQEELEILLRKLRERADLRRETAEKLLEFHGIAVSRRDFLDFLAETAFSRSLMSVFLRYLQDSLQLDRDFRGISALFLGFCVRKVDVFKGFVELSPFFCDRSAFSLKNREFSQKFRDIVAVLWYEDRYLLSFLRNPRKTVHFADFLHEDLGEIPFETAELLGKAVFSQELGLENLKFIATRAEKHSVFKDFGDLVAVFVYKLLKTVDFDEISLKNSEKIRFRDIFAWILLKLSAQNRETVYFFEFLPKIGEDLRVSREKTPKNLRKSAKKPEKLPEIPAFLEKPKEISSTFLSFSGFSAENPEKLREAHKKLEKVAEKGEKIEKIEKIAAEPANLQGKRYFGRKIAENPAFFSKNPRKSAESEELVLEKSVLKEFLREYKEKVREKQDFSENSAEKEEDFTEKHEKHVALSRKQLKNLLQQHEDYVRNEFFEEVLAENQLISKENAEKSRSSQESREESRNKPAKTLKKAKKSKKLKKKP